MLGVQKFAASKPVSFKIPACKVRILSWSTGVTETPLKQRQEINRIKNAKT